MGERGRAEAEFRRLWPEAQANPAIARALLLVAEAANLDELQDDLASALHLAGAEPALPQLRPRGGYMLNPALGSTPSARVESAFTARTAVSPRRRPGPDAAPPRSGRPRLQAKAAVHCSIRARTSALGQRFLAYLSRDGIAGDNLLRVLVAYNAGPHRRPEARRRRRRPRCCSSKPCPTTKPATTCRPRSTYMGAYAERFGVPSPALDALAAGGVAGVLGGAAALRKARALPSTRWGLRPQTPICLV